MSTETMINNPKISKLPFPVLGRAAAPILEELGKTPKNRLKSLLAIFIEQEKSTITLAEAYLACFPTAKDAEAGFRKFRQVIREAAKAADVEFSLEVDTSKQSKPESRSCWFEGEDPTEAALTEFSLAGTQGLTPYFIPTRAAGKIPIKIFRSYAQKDHIVAQRFERMLLEYFRISPHYEFTIWQDQDIHVGDGWQSAIAEAMQDAHFGLFLVSPNFLASQFVTEIELPFFEQTGRVFPVGLIQFDLATTDMKGFEERQLFLHGEPGDKRFFNQCSTDKLQREFCIELRAEIEAKISRLREKPPAVAEISLVPDECVDPEIYETVRGFQRPQARPFGLRELERIDFDRARDEPGVDALGFLTDWLTDPQSPPFCAVLGEYGIGKTTTLKKLTRDLLERRKAGELDLPFPIYVDLRDYHQNIDSRVPELGEILANLIQRNWKNRAEKPAITPADIIRQVREDGAVIIFDGLDEKIVHLNANEARAFIRELWRILPPARDGVTGGQGEEVTGREGKLLLSCRSQYFQDVWSQNAMLLAESRDGIKSEDYRACIILPFKQAQIEGFLTEVLGEDLVESAMELLRSIHNLEELAERPFNLDLLVDHVDELQQLQAAGRTVRGVTLYQLLVRKWLHRDDGKHVFSHGQKLQLMEELARRLVEEETHELPWDDVEEWLSEYLTENPRFLALITDEDKKRLAEDFRTATFILRPDTKQSHFRFAHTSLEEYFHACWLVRQLENGEDVAQEAWAAEVGISDETLEFVAQLIDCANKPGKILKTWAQLLETNTPVATKLAFRVWLRAWARGYREPKLETGADLEGED
ncbi:MAG: NACHT domain-containing protein, partial [Verrucomicrobiota bacterium]